MDILLTTHLGAKFSERAALHAWFPGAEFIAELDLLAGKWVKAVRCNRATDTDEVCSFVVIDSRLAHLWIPAELIEDTRGDPLPPQEPMPTHRLRTTPRPRKAPAAPEKQEELFG